MNKKEKAPHYYYDGEPRWIPPEVLPKYMQLEARIEMLESHTSHLNIGMIFILVVLMGLLLVAASGLLGN